MKCVSIKSMFFRCIYPRNGQHRFDAGNFVEKNQRLEEKTIMDSILDEKIYDARIRPSSLNSSDGPTNIQVNLMIRSIDKIDDVKMEFSVQITFRWDEFNSVFLSKSLLFVVYLQTKMVRWSVAVHWQSQSFDARYASCQVSSGQLFCLVQNLLINSNPNCPTSDKIKYLTITEPGKVWMPDTFFRNERRGSMHNVLVPNLYVRIFADGMVLFSIRVSLTLSCPMNLKLYPLDRQTCPMQIASCELIIFKPDIQRCCWTFS